MHIASTQRVSGDILRALPTDWTNPERSFERIKRWYRKCSEEHEGCRVDLYPEEGADRLPTRVIEVGSPSDCQARLIETRGKSGSYAALSYCWGRSQTFTTQPETYQERLRGFNLDELPPTIRDAVILTRELGIPYLWVDAICILQGDVSDWENESAKMSQVYGKATITICAATAQDTSVGCFVTKGVDEGPMIALKSKCSSSNEEGVMLISFVPSGLREEFGRYYFEDAMDKCILNQRGWALQERVLSPRKIHFAQDQMYWECREQFKSEEGEHDTVLIWNFDEEEPDMDIPGPCLRDSHWLEWVKDYSCRKLTQPSDKLPALSGLAELVQSRTGYKYLAGIWQEHLPSALLWKPQGEGPRKPVSQWRAPSWSWASIDGKVDFEERIWFGYYLRIIDCAEVVSCEVELASANEFGAVIAAWLKLKASVRHASRGASPIKEGNSLRGDWFQLLDDSGKVVGGVRFDDNTNAPPLHFDCLRICAGSTKVTDECADWIVDDEKPKESCTDTSFSSSDDIDGEVDVARILVVIATGHAGHYFRVGVGEVVLRASFAWETPREITLH